MNQRSANDTTSPTLRFHVHLSDRRLAEPLPLSFEQAQSRLEALPRLHFEPDGSFVWAGANYQVFGMLYDAAGLLQYVELRGECPLAIWRQLVNCMLDEPSIREIRRPGGKSTISVMTLPQRQWQELQRFESLFVA